MKYCCQIFEESLKRQKESYPNIRVVKFVSEFLVDHKGVFKLGNDAFFKHDNIKKGPYRFYITTGYSNFNMEIPSFNINFCPFCGTNLYDFYKGDEYANEIEGVSFNLVSR